jgi:Bacterial conjugation TrbI-like protein
MSETAVRMENEMPAEQSWFRRFFYRRDGEKWTLLTREISGISVLVFCVVAVALVLSGPPKLEPAGGTSEFSSPASSEDSGNVNVPPAISSSVDGGANRVPSKRRTSQVAEKYFGPQMISRPKLPISPGSTVKAKLITGATDGPVRAEFLESLSHHGETIAEPGTILMGSGSSTDSRLLIKFNQMIFKDGAIQTVQGQAFDPEDKIAGLKGSQLGNKALKLTGAIGLNFLGGVSDGLQDTDVKGGVPFKSSTLKNALLNGAARAALDESHDLMSSLKEGRPTIQIDAGKEIVVQFE